jgi:hypothetical protein
LAVNTMPLIERVDVTPLTPRRGALEPDSSRPGFGLQLKRSEAARYAA